MYFYTLDYTRNNLELLSFGYIFQFSFPYFFNSITRPEPPRYNAKSAPAISNCVTGSVEGVIIAANVVAITTTYFQADNICFPDIMPNNPKIIWITGT